MWTFHFDLKEAIVLKCGKTVGPLFTSCKAMTNDLGNRKMRKTSGAEYKKLYKS